MSNDVLIPGAARSKAWVCGRSLAETVGFESRPAHGCLSLVNVVQRSPAECGTSECDREASIKRP